MGDRVDQQEGPMDGQSERLKHAVYWMRRTAAGGAMTEDEQILKVGHTSYLIRYQVHEWWADFRAWQATGMESFEDDAPLLYGYPHTQTDPADLPPLVEGSVKWDGCANFAWPDSQEVATHTCTREDMEAIGTLLTTIWDGCMARIPGATP